MRSVAAIGLAAGLALALWRLDTYGVFNPGHAAGSIDAGLPAGIGAPGRPARLLAFGSSLSRRGDWPERLATALSACRADGVEAARLARPGGTIAWGTSQIDAALALAPDLILMEFSVNDASLAHGIALGRAATLLEQTLARAKAAGVPVLLMSMNPAFGAERWERPGHPAYLALYRAQAEAGRAGWLDITGAWHAMPAELRDRLIPDGLHPTAEGMARILTPALLAMLAPRLCDPGATPDEIWPRNDF
jgi:acyl-CoA thioesterase-1